MRKFFFVSYVERRRNGEWAYFNYAIEGSPARWATKHKDLYGSDCVVLYAEEISRDQYEYYQDYEYLCPVDRPLEED